MPSAAHEVTHELTDEQLLARLTATVMGSPEVVDRNYGVDLHAAHSPEAMVYDEAEGDLGSRSPDGTPGVLGVPEPAAGFRFYDPLPNAADEYIHFAQTPHERVYLGIDAFDGVMRGLAPGELLLITGFAQSCKTVLSTEFVLNNRHANVAIFTPDETRVLVLIKLVSIVHGVSAEELERRIFQQDKKAIDMVRGTASEVFPRLAVFDQTLSTEHMHRALDEAEQSWGGKADAMVYDYAGLHPEYEDPRGAIACLKNMGKQRRLPTVVLHQSSRTAGKDGQRPTLTSGGYGGEQEATFLIGVRRKKSELLAMKYDLELRIRTSTKDTSMLAEMLHDVEHELSQHQETVTAVLLKNKRPPARLVDEVDFHLHPDTGKIEVLEHGDLVHSLANRDTWQQSEAF